MLECKYRMCRNYFPLMIGYQIWKIIFSELKIKFLIGKFRKYHFPCTNSIWDSFFGQIWAILWNFTHFGESNRLGKICFLLIPDYLFKLELKKRNCFEDVCIIQLSTNKFSDIGWFHPQKTIQKSNWSSNRKWKKFLQRLTCRFRRKKRKKEELWWIRMKNGKQKKRPRSNKQVNMLCRVKCIS